MLIVLINQNNAVKYYIKSNDEIKYQERYQEHLPYIFIKGILGNICGRCHVEVMDSIHINNEQNQQIEQSHQELHGEIANTIRQRRAIATIDTSIKGIILAIHWIITTLDK